MKNRVLSFLTYLIGWPFSLLALFFIVGLIYQQLQTIILHPEQLHFGLLLIAIPCFMFFYLLKSYLWQTILRYQGYQLRFHDTCFFWLTSEIKRYVPGNIWAFLGRSVLFHKQGIQKKDIAKGLIIEAEIMVISAAIVSLFLLSFIEKHYFPNLVGVLTDIIPLILLVCVAVYVFSGKLRSVSKIFRVILPSFFPHQLITLILIHTLAFIFYGLGYYFAITSITNLSPNLIMVLIGLFTFSFLVGYLSLLTPSGLGVREGVMVFGLIQVMVTNLAALVSVFARLILIVSEVLLVLVAYLLHRFQHRLTTIEAFLKKYKYELILLTLMLMYAIYFINVTFLRYDNFYTGRFDLGNMAQTVWNTLRGRIFIFTNPNGTESISRLAFHADFLLILLAPFYAIWTDPRMLLLIQTIVVDCGSLFVYLIAKDVIKNKPFALVFALAFLVNPSIQRANLYDFHAVTLSTTFLLATYYFYRLKKYMWFLLFAFLAGISKEEVWLLISLFGVFLFIQQKKRILGTLVTAVGLGLFILLIWYAIPHSLGTHHFALTYYSDFGEKPLMIIKTVFFSPQKTIMTIFHADRLDYLNQLFIPLGYLSFLNPLYLLFTIPDLLIDLLSNNTQLHQIYYQYTSNISPFLFISAIVGSGFLIRLFPKKNITFYLTIYLLVVSVFEAYQYGPLPGAKDPNIDMIIKPVVNRDYINYYLSHIPKRYSVASTNNVGSHLSQRQVIYTLPQGIDKADVIVFLLTDQSSLNPETALAEKLMKDPTYVNAIKQDAFIVFVKASLYKNSLIPIKSFAEQQNFYHALKRIKPEYL